MHVDQHLNELKCCMPHVPEHFVDKDPKLFSCGHPVCSLCIIKIANNESCIGTLCSRCNQANHLDLKTIPIVSFANTMFELSLADFSKTLYKKLEKVGIEISCETIYLKYFEKNSFFHIFKPIRKV